MSTNSLIGSVLVLNILLTLVIAWGVCFVGHNNNDLSQRIEVLECKVDSLIDSQQDTVSVSIITRDSIQVMITK